MVEKINKDNQLYGGIASAATLTSMMERDGFRSPDLFAQRIDPLANTALILRMSQAAYRATSFLVLPSRTTPWCDGGTPSTSRRARSTSSSMLVTSVRLCSAG